jgi:hypothetical protein
MRLQLAITRLIIESTLWSLCMRKLDDERELVLSRGPIFLRSRLSVICLDS